MIIVFSDRKISTDISGKFDDILLYPPVEQGQLMDIVDKKNPTVVIIVDCAFDGAMPAWHKEIIYTIKNGVNVYGVGA